MQQSAQKENLLSVGDVEMRWVDTYFPFTNPSFELEIYFQVFFTNSIPLLILFCMQFT